MDYREIKRETIIAFLVVMVALSFWSGTKYTQWRLANQPIEIPLAAMERAVEDKATDERIYVHVAGAVSHPGVYTLTKGDRIDDLLKLARPLENADIDNFLNRAALLSDSDKIYVPHKEGLTNGGILPGEITISSSYGGGYPGNSKININRATEKELESLTGIGPTRAQAIIEYRKNNGNFRTIEDIMKVKGIGTATFENIKERITV